MKNKQKRILKDIHQCPRCGKKEIYKTRVDYVCTSCSWNSAEDYVKAGGMDGLINAYFEHFSEEEVKEHLSPPSSKKNEDLPPLPPPIPKGREKKGMVNFKREERPIRPRFKIPSQEELYEYVTKRKDSQGGVVFEGDRYLETSGFPLSKMKALIQKELSRLQKNGELPKFRHEIRWNEKTPKILEIKICEIGESPFSDYFFNSLLNYYLEMGKSPQEIVFEFMERDHQRIHNELGRYIHLKLNQLLWRFNLEHFQILENGGLRKIDRRFTVWITYSKGLIKRNLRLITED